MIERDDDIPELPALLAELSHARRIAAETLGQAAAPNHPAAASHG